MVAGYTPGRINGKDVLYKQATGDVLTPNGGRVLGRMHQGKFIPTVGLLGDPAESGMMGGSLEMEDPAGESASDYEYASDYGAEEDKPKPAPATTPMAAPAAATPAAAKPKFSAARAKTFEGKGGYKYAIDPETNVIAILESPNRTSGDPVYVRPDGKFQDAHKAILAEYRARMVTPATVQMDSGPKKVPTSEPVPSSDSAQPSEKPRRRRILTSLLNSTASDISSDDI
jgi:hypothetical protein